MKTVGYKVETLPQGFFPSFQLNIWQSTCFNWIAVRIFLGYQLAHVASQIAFGAGTFSFTVGDYINIKY